MPRSLPDADAVILSAIRDHLTVSGASVMPLRDREWLSRFPLVTARAITADATQMVDFRFFAEVDVQCWHNTRQGASDLHDAVVAALRASRRSTYHGGSIARLESPIGTELRTDDQPDDVWRWQSSPRITIRVAP